MHTRHFNFLITFIKQSKHEDQILDRIVFRNREEYEAIDWYVTRTTDQGLNVILVYWLQYIKNVKKLRDDQSPQDKKKLITIRDSQMQLKQSQFEIISDKTLQVDEDFNKNLKQQFKIPQSKGKLKLKLKNQIDISADKQLGDELNLQQQMQKNQYTDEKMLNDLQEEVIEIVPKQQTNENYIRILPQFPKEAIQQKFQKMLKNKVLSEQLQKGYLYLNQEELTNLDQQISQFLHQIKYQERQIKIMDIYYALSSPLYVLSNPHPLNMTRQWWYYRNKDHVRFYIIHGQLIWYLYQYYQIKSQETLRILNEVIAYQQQEYMNRWAGLLIDDEQINWTEANESSLVSLRFFINYL